MYRLGADLSTASGLSHDVLGAILGTLVIVLQSHLSLGQLTKPLRRPARDAQCQSVFVPGPDDLCPEREPVRPLNAGERDAGEPEQRPHPAEERISGRP